MRRAIFIAAVGLLVLGANFPSSIYDSQSPATRRDSTLTQSEWNDLQDEVTAIETHVSHLLCTFIQGTCTGLNCNAPSCTGANTDQTIIASCDVPANTLDGGRGLRYVVDGTYYANGNTKNVQVWFGSTNLSGSSATAQNGGGWSVDATVLALTNTAETGHAIVRSSGGGILGASQQTAIVEFVNTNITVKITGTNTTGHAGDICAVGGWIELLR